MTTDNFILRLATYLSEAGLPNPLTEAARFVIDNPGIETDTSADDAAQEYLAGCADAADWKDPARYRAS
jgi:hypothetical protein